jgi:lysophospholipase L1-like esterase
MEWYEPDVRELERIRAEQKYPTHPVVFYGSSTVRLWDTLANDFAGEPVINLGFGGSTLEACVYFFERLVPPVNPCSLVVYAGDNDLGDGQAPEKVLASFQALQSKVRQTLADIEFGFISIKPSPARFSIIEKIRAANEAIRSEIESSSGAYFIDIFDGMLDSAGGPRHELFGEDGLHLNREGYRVWVELLSPYCNRIFTKDCLSSKSTDLPLLENESRISQMVQPESES